MKTPEELSQAFERWKAKKGEKLLKLYQEKAAKEKSGEIFAPVSERIHEIEKEISQKKAHLDRRLSLLYARIYRSGASSAAKKERQKRTHHLCNLGGLVEKAGLGELKAAALLGMLIQQAEFLANNPGVLDRWEKRGEEALNTTEE